jgi:hypothetical protein
MAQRLNGSSVTDPQDAYREMERGCVRRHCDDPEGFLCRDNWECDPENAPGEASGCVPIACADAGSCSDNDFYICEPEGDGPRPNGVDVHGCVVRTCSEGSGCQDFADCRPGSDEADAWGCVVRNCEEFPELCGAMTTCDREASITDIFGCRPLDCHDPDGPVCPNGTICEPVIHSSIYQCVMDPSGASGGTGGSNGPGRPPGASGMTGVAGAVPVPLTGGRASTGGSSSTAGKASTGGTSPGEASGICVARD